MARLKNSALVYFIGLMLTSFIIINDDKVPVAPILIKKVEFNNNNKKTITMGWDISYHPISEEQINEWYFNVLEDQNLIERLSSENGIEEFYKEKYIETIAVALETEKNDIFDKTHGYYIAVVQGFFQEYFYTRGAALSFIENPSFQKYFKSWDQIVPKDKLTENVNNRIIENYCSGVFIPYDKVVELLEDYNSDPEIKKELDNVFSHNRIDVFLNALNFAKENNLGLLEATEVIEPNPLDLEDSSCYSNLYNCDIDGPRLYAIAVLEQMKEIKEQQKSNNEEEK